MHTRTSQTRGYILAALLGAAGGGLVTIIATRAIPGMMVRMMQNMMASMCGSDLAPEEI